VVQRSWKQGLLAWSAVLALGLLVILATRGGERSSPRLPREPEQVDSAPPQSVLSERAAEPTAAREPAKIGRKTPRKKRIQQAPQATLVVQAVAEDSGKPIDGVRVLVDASGTLRGRTTAERSAVECSVPSGVGIRLHVEGQDLLFGRASTFVPALAAGERREVVVRLPVGGLHYFGRVLGEGGAPVAGARIALSVSSDEPRARHATDAAGLFELVVGKREPEEPLELRIEAPGLAVALGRVEPGHDTPERAQVFRLRPSATLVGRVLDGLGRPLTGRVVVVRAPGGALRQPRPSKTSFEHQDVEPWVAESDGGGAYRLDDLPARTALRAEAPREEGLRPEVHDLVLCPGEVRYLDFVLENPVSLSLLVLDPEGEPLPGLELRAERASSPESGCFSNAGFVVVRTDDHGWCRTERAVPGLWRIGPLRDARTDLAPWGERIEVQPVPASQSAVLRLPRGLYLRGRVEGPGGAPAKRATVSVRSEPCDRERVEHAVRDGTFEIGPLVAGEYLLEARARSGLLGGGEVRAPAGAQGIVLRLPRSSGSIHGEVFAGGSPAEQAVVRILPGTGRPACERWTSEEGRFAFKRLPPGLYDLFATDGKGGWGQALDLAPGPGSGPPARIELAPAATVRVVYVGEARLATVRALRGERVVASDEVASGLDGILWVPPGTLTIELLMQDGGSTSLGTSRRVVARLDEEVEVTFP
jgi:hypothetical protein